MRCLGCAACDHYFPSPPLPSELVRAQLERAELGNAMLCAEVGVRLNAALCEYHHIAEVGFAPPPCAVAGRSRSDAICPGPSLADMLMAERESDAIGTPTGCDDGDARCADWAAQGECDANAMVVRPLCPWSCDEPRCAHSNTEADGDGGTNEAADAATISANVADLHASYSQKTSGGWSGGEGAATRDVLDSESAGHSMQSIVAESRTTALGELDGLAGQGLVVARRSMHGLLDIDRRAAEAGAPIGELAADEADELIGLGAGAMPSKRGDILAMTDTDEEQHAVQPEVPANATGQHEGRERMATLTRETAAGGHPHGVRHGGEHAAQRLETEPLEDVEIDGDASYGASSSLETAGLEDEAWHGDGASLSTRTTGGGNEVGSKSVGAPMPGITLDSRATNGSDGATNLAALTQVEGAAGPTTIVESATTESTAPEWDLVDAIAVAIGLIGVLGVALFFRELHRQLRSLCCRKRRIT